MNVDTAVVRHLAGQLRDRAEDIRDEAGQLVQRIGEVPWDGAAAAAMRTQSQLRLALLAQAAGLHDDAAEALDQHAGAVDEAVALINAVAAAAGQVVEGAETAAGAVADQAGDVASGVADAVRSLPGVLR